MDLTGCSGGFASDAILRFDTPPELCDMRVSGWLGIVISIASLRFAIAVGQTHLWVRRERRRREKDTRDKRDFVCGSRVPLVPFVSWVSFIVLSLTAILISTNQANRYNGGSIALIGLGFAIPSVAHILFLFKFVSLSHRLLGRGKLGASIDQEGRLSTLGGFGKVLVFGAIIGIIGSVVSSLIIGLIFTNEYIVVRVMFGFKSLYLLCLATAQTSHIERIRRAVMDVARSDLRSSEEGRRELKLVVRKLREQQISVGAAGMVGSIPFFLIACGFVDAFYFVWTLPIIFETVAIFVILVSNYNYIRKNKQGNSSKTTSSQRPGNETSPQVEQGIVPRSILGTSFVA